MSGSTTDTLRAALRAIQDPATGRDLAAAGLIDSLELRGGLVHVALRTNRARAAAMSPESSGSRPAPRNGTARVDKTSSTSRPRHDHTLSCLPSR